MADPLDIAHPNTPITRDDGVSGDFGHFLSHDI